MAKSKTVLEVGKTGIATAFTGMNLLNIAKGKDVKLSAGKEEHLKRAREVAGGAIDAREYAALKLGNPVELSTFLKSRGSRPHTVVTKEGVVIPETKLPPTIVPKTVQLGTISGTAIGGACVTGTLITARNYLKCSKGHVTRPGDKVVQRHGTTICPICGGALNKFTPTKIRSRGEGLGLATGRGRGPIGRR